MNTATPTCYQTKAATTRSRRQAAGRYRKPTKGQEAAFKKAMARDGRKHLTAEECALLGDHPYLAPSQRNEYINLAIAKGW